MTGITCLQSCPCQFQGSNATLEYPPVAVAVSAILAVCCTMWIPVVAAYKLIRTYLFPRQNDDKPTEEQYDMPYYVNPVSQDNQAFDVSHK